MTSQQTMQLLEIDRRLFPSSDDDPMMKQVLDTHAPDGRDVDVRPILDAIEKVLQRDTPTVVVAPQTHLDDVEGKGHYEKLVGVLEVLAFAVHRVACEISCNCSERGDEHETTMAVFSTLRSYSWDVKVVLALAAFAASYGEFWLERTDPLKPQFDALNTNIKSMLDVAKCIIELKELPTEYITPDTPALKMAIFHIPTAIYLTIRSVVACSSLIIGFIGMDLKYIASTIDAGELQTLAHKVSNKRGQLSKQLSRCHQHIDEQKDNKDYERLVHLFDSIHLDNMTILRSLLHWMDDMPLVYGATKRRVSVDVLRRKIVILFISELDLSKEELFVFTVFYNESQHGKERDYEVVWLPVIDKLVPWTDSREELFVHMASSMPWYSPRHPSLLKPAVIKYIKEVWHFEKMPLLVVLDAQGRVLCPNALYMMWIWGNVAFPFTSFREETLWRKENWSFEFLMADIDPTILQWVREGVFICLYGGEDIEWIRRFTSAMRGVAQEARIPLEMVYVGKRNPKERVRKIITTITNENLSGSWHDLVMIWYFWARLESMWHSKMQLGHTIENDAIMQGVMTMLAYDGSDEGWALVSTGSTEMVISQGKKIVECLLQFDAWKKNFERGGFIAALKNALSPYHTSREHCIRFILPGKQLEDVLCAECLRPMEKFILYRCCND